MMACRRVRPGSPRTRVLGHSQSSLRDWSRWDAVYPGLATWATLSRPAGLNLDRVVLTHSCLTGCGKVGRGMKPHLFKTYVRAEARTLQKPELSRSLFSPLGQRRLDRALARLRPLLGGPHAG